MAPELHTLSVAHVMKSSWQSLCDVLSCFYGVGGTAVFKDIMAGKDTNTTVLAMSDIIRFKNINEPLQGHLSLTSDPTQMM